MLNNIEINKISLEIWLSYLMFNKLMFKLNRKEDIK